uniref:Interferon-induced protein with tetratricopeptide repeats 5-like n=1 Tax=Saccoglossus kowalevskii TaxID=10224 RepID=A0ABM0MHB5_SACKO|nr:PREDICTED: interferon-induced protein with tetratricopeptide repeats 5-like [Saccoglossus kowalevskii]
MSHLDHHLRDNPDYVPVPSKSLRGYLYMSPLHKPGERDPHEALEWFDKALDDTTRMTDKEGQIGDRIVVPADKAHVLFLLGEYEDVKIVITELKKYIHQINRPKAFAYIQAHQAFALSWFGQANIERGIGCFDKALDVLPNQESWLFGKARLHSRHSSTADSGQGASQEEIIYNKILQINETHILAKVYLALNANRRHSDFEAEWHFEKALDYGRDRVTVVQRVAQYYESKNNLNKAMELYNTALAIEPESSFIHYHIGVIYRKMAQKLKAIDRTLVCRLQLDTSTWQ